jgi:hypothetical protein
MNVTASWTFYCSSDQARMDPFDMDLVGDQYVWGYGVGGSDSTHFTVGDTNVDFSVTTFPDCKWTLTGTLTPG